MYNSSNSRYNLSSLRHFTSTPQLSEIPEEDTDDEDGNKTR